MAALQLNPLYQKIRIVFKLYFLGNVLFVR